jgi:hypothetical protein
MKKTVISANLFTPELKLTFNCVLFDSLVNRIFGYQKPVLFGSIHLPIFQILRTLFFFSFDEKNYYISQFIYALTKTHVELRFLWFLSESDFWDLKAVLFGSFRLPIFPIRRTLWFYFVWCKKLLYQPIYLLPDKNSRWITFCVVR